MMALRLLTAAALLLHAPTARAHTSACRDKMRELCHGTAGQTCLDCTSGGAAALRQAGCSVGAIDGMCLQTRVLVEAAGGAVPTHIPLLVGRAASMCSAQGGDPTCSTRMLGSAEPGDVDAVPSLCLESSAVPTDNYYVTATSLLVGNDTSSGAPNAVFPATHMLQLRAFVNDVHLSPTTLSFSHFVNYDQGRPGGNLSSFSTDLNPTTTQVSDGDIVRVGALWSVTVAGHCVIEDPDPTFSCDREAAQCVEDNWPIPGGERNHSKCEEGCLRVDPCADGFEYQNISDTWRNIHNKGDGPPDPDGRGCSRGHCYGMDAIDLANDTNWACSKSTTAGTGVGGGRWYRFIGKDNTGMATAPVANDHCGTAWPGWLSGWGDVNEIGAPPKGYNEPGRYPELGEGILDGTACFVRSCDTHLPVSTVRCSNSDGEDYLLWKLQYTHCSAAYCTDRHNKRESPCESGEYTTLDDEWRSVEHTGRATLPDGTEKMVTDLPVDKRCPYPTTVGSGVGDDHWYRFIGKGGTGLALASPGHNHCGTSDPGWLSGWNASKHPEAPDPPATYAEPGRYPTADEGAVEMTACFDARDGFQGPRVPCAASKQVGVHQCPNGGPLLWRLPYAPDIWGASGDCTYGYCTDPNAAAAAAAATTSYGNRGAPQNRSKQ
eukprot:COSAG06_NODE_620_length_13728_cov_23.894563_4_plen_660_part_00